ncbi:hypothetical protein [Micromonospora humida]
MSEAAYLQVARVYTHLRPTSEDRTRRAIDAAVRHGPTTPDGPATA